ncbi:hypothetical protein [Streptomyces sp. NPDC088360]|uniref:hypothetical protein n=1 Tax=unclassified Streptomyces TaxID=2593676 RepID=UPI00344B1317
MDAVLETYQAKEFTLWPVADFPPDGLLSLSGPLTPRQVGTAMAVLTDYNKGQRKRGQRCAEDPAEQMRALVAAETVAAPGGLRVRDTATGVTASPGCCFGLENWRDWLDLTKGEEPWLGHDPTPRTEHVGTSIRLWPDENRRTGPHIDIPRAELPELLESVRDNLVGFLGSVDRWTAALVPPLPPALTTALMAKLDAGLAVSAPLLHGQN